MRLTFENPPANRSKIAHLSFHLGEQETFTIRPMDSARQPLLGVTACRVGFRHGRYQNPGDAVVLTTPVAATVTDGVVTLPLSASQTREFDAGQPYCWLMELEFSTGKVKTYWEGNVYPFKEVV